MATTIGLYNNIPETKARGTTLDKLNRVKDRARLNRSNKAKSSVDIPADNGVSKTNKVK